MELMKKIFIIGTTEYSFMIHSMIEQERQFEVLGHSVNKEYLKENEGICKKRGTRIYALEDLQNVVGANSAVNVINTVGYSNMNKMREKMFDLCISLGYIPTDFISKRAICLSCSNGKGNIIFPGAYIGTNVSMGYNNVIYAGAVLTHDISIGNHNFVAANTTIGGVVSIGNNCFIGMGSVIRNRLNISDYTLIGAGAYLDVDAEEKDVFVPPKAIKLIKKSSEVNLIPRQK